jgi:glycosyltransferase involved in cell wall biosynthesis
LFTLDAIDTKYADGVVIFGKMNFEPNVNSVEWFVKNVLPFLPNHIKLYVIGAEPSVRITNLAQKNSRIIVTGFISNPYPLMRGAIANLCPIQIGGGIQNKVLEGLAIGALGLISPLAAAPMPEIECSGLVVCDEPKEWLRIILEAESNPQKFDSNRNIGRSYALKHFSWEAYSKAVNNSISYVTSNQSN